jgi:hypothetical protein
MLGQSNEAVVSGLYMNGPRHVGRKPNFHFRRRGRAHQSLDEAPKGRHVSNSEHSQRRYTTARILVFEVDKNELKFGLKLESRKFKVSCLIKKDAACSICLHCLIKADVGSANKHQGGTNRKRNFFPILCLAN